MKRFYRKVTTAGDQGGFTVALDGKPVKTPMKLPLAVPAARLAKGIAREWNAQKDNIDPYSMPLTRLANTALDRTRMHKDIVVAEIMNFARHDLLCYRATEPEELKTLESEAWDPFLAWARDQLGIAFKTTAGIEAIAQDEKALSRLQGMLEVLDPFPLTALHNATTLSGSAVLALALWEGVEPAEDIWTAANVDETYQKDRWGEDKEAAAALAAKRELWLACSRFFDALR